MEKGDSPDNIDVVSERMVLSSLFEYGQEALIVCDDKGLIPSDFFHKTDNDIFFVIKELLDKEPNKKIDADLIKLQLKEKNKKSTFTLVDDNNYLEVLSQKHVNFDNLDKFVLAVKKKAIYRNVIAAIENAKVNIEDFSGNDISLEDFLVEVSKQCNGVIEKASNPNEKFDTFASSYEEYLDFLSSNPCENLGIPTGFRTYDFHIGRGLRRGTVNIIGARPGVGKSLIALNIANHVASNGVPVLYIDTELSKDQQMGRLSAMRTGVTIDDIETGKFSKDQNKKDRILGDLPYFKKIQLYHKYVGGQTFEEILIAMKKWVRQVVGEDENGNVKDCVIVYDYLKMMNTKGLENLKEYQLIGFYMSSLHDFCVRYNVPMLLTLQLNRDGIEKIGGVASQSDRIEWLTSTFAILKNLDREEQKSDSNMKIVITKSRFGPVTPDDTYIKILADKRIARLEDMGLSRYSDGYEKTSATEQKTMSCSQVGFAEKKEMTNRLEIALNNIPASTGEHTSPF
jgi:replicative DNA helicase